MRFFYTFLLLLAFNVAFSQATTQISFLKENGVEVLSKDSADYIRIISAPDSGSAYYLVKEFYVNGKIRLLGHASKISPLILEGACSTYYVNGKRSEALTYKKGRLVNNQYSFYPNGNLEAEKYYPEKMNNNAVFFDYLYTIHSYADTTGKLLVANGSGTYKTIKIIDRKRVPETWLTEGEVKNGIRHGEWKSSIGGDSIKLTEKYVNGRLVSGVATFANGETCSYIQPETPPVFKGGANRFVNFITSNLRYPPEARAGNITGTVLISFTIDVNGLLTNVYAKGGVTNKYLVAEAIRVVKSSPKWGPGKQFGRIVNTTLTLPVVFGSTAMY